METLNKLAEIINEYKGEKFDITAATTFDELGFDSLDKVDLMMQVEEKFEVVLGDDLVVSTIGELSDKINSLKA